MLFNAVSLDSHSLLATSSTVQLNNDVSLPDFLYASISWLNLSILLVTDNHSTNAVDNHLFHCNKFVLYASTILSLFHSLIALSIFLSKASTSSLLYHTHLG